MPIEEARIDLGDLYKRVGPFLRFLIQMALSALLSAVASTIPVGSEFRVPQPPVTLKTNAFDAEAYIVVRRSR